IKCGSSQVQQAGAQAGFVYYIRERSSCEDSLSGNSRSYRWWRTHSCVPRRDSSRRIWMATKVEQGVENSLDAARRSACATSLRVKLTRCPFCFRAVYLSRSSFSRPNMTRILSIVTLLLGLSSVSLSQIVTGAIVGSATDASGGGVANVAITVSNMQTG